MTTPGLEIAVRLAGCAQLLMAVTSTAIPVVLGWRAETARLRPLTRQVFWTYAGYILGIHVAFGLLSALAPRWLLDGSPLAAAVTGFIATYWVVRLGLQLFCFDRHDVPPGRHIRVAEAALLCLLCALPLVYGAAFLFNVRS